MSVLLWITYKTIMIRNMTSQFGEGPLRKNYTASRQGKSSTDFPPPTSRWHNK